MYFRAFFVDCVIKIHRKIHLQCLPYAVCPMPSAFGISLISNAVSIADAVTSISETNLIPTISNSSNEGHEIIVEIKHKLLGTYNFKECDSSIISSGNDKRQGVRSLFYIGNIITYFVITCPTSGSDILILISRG